jgi:hypothetical protein
MISTASDVSFLAPSGLTVTLSPDEYRLALLGQIEFEGAWEGLETATLFVADGPAKLALIRQRVRPLADDLTPLGDGVDSLTLVAARHWFRHGLILEDRKAGVVA